MIRGIHHVAVHVHDMERMIRFYKDAFGFEVVGEPFSWEKDDFVDRIVAVKGSASKGAMLRAGSCYMELFQYSAPKPNNTKGLDPFDKGYTHFCVDVTDIGFEFERLKGLGMTFPEPEPINVGHVITIYGRDPEGNLIEIQETIDSKCDFPLDCLTPISKKAK
ncbi:VOC family protein [Ketobacter sp. MCCC 1A13808]|uniref:VOC family protein n=1 Tax=Ketobacter sp. MCCC 1A13808 TaxID=2602738 RepID=UPI000F1E532E|nr:VOC family protein [Ketobacter sp. MCCC 1A13808]MVF13473.1 VOC family protein [Ketobacter sp. MCCC 1A13808]RLP52394.1 MAG: VOC family protein [Ketobacter sp.]